MERLPAYSRPFDYTQYERHDVAAEPGTNRVIEQIQPGVYEKSARETPVQPTSTFVSSGRELVVSCSPSAVLRNPPSATQDLLVKPPRPQQCGEFSSYYSLPHQHITAWVQPKPGSSIALKNGTILPGKPGWHA